MRKSFGFFFALALLIALAVAATTRPNEKSITNSEMISPGDVEDRAILIKTEADEIFKVLSEFEELSIFSTVLRASGMFEKLNVNEGFAVFAPNNMAFDALPKGTLETLLLPEKHESLVALVKNHIYDGKTNSADISSYESLKSWSGKASEVKSGGEGVFLGEAKLIQTDIEVQDGLVHIIDKVLLSK
jgi:uncharacterized surface protein with fasciclin (FAS1) repeats